MILANSTLPLRAVEQATHTVPVVFTTIIDPVGQGFVASLAHPGGNVTGFSYLDVSVGGKWMDLLKEIAPRTTHIACMFNPERGPYLWRANIAFGARGSEKTTRRAVCCGTGFGALAGRAGRDGACA